MKRTKFTAGRTLNVRVIGCALLLGGWTGFAEIRTIEIKEAPFPFAVNEWTPPARSFPITSYGAKPDGKPVTEAVEKAVAAAHAAGGGRVTVPPGEWLTGAFKLKSGVALVMEDGAVLRFPDDPVIVFRRPLRADGRPVMTQGGLVQADGCTNVAVMGKGTFKADVAYWHRGHAANPKRGFPRPQVFKFTRCKNIRFEGFKIRGSPEWTMHFTLCEDVIVRGVDSVCSGPNTDGLDLESCERALVEDCSLDQTDDTYTLKSGFNEAGRKRNRPTQNVVIRRCKAVQGHGLLAIGSEVSGGVRNVWMTDCTVEASCGSWLFLKTNAKRGGYVENVTMENIRGRRAGNAVMTVEMFYDCNPVKELTGKDETAWYTRIDGVTVRNVVCEEAGQIVRVAGDMHCPPTRLRAENIRVGRITRRHAENAVSVRNAPDFTARNVRVDPTAAYEILSLPPGVRVLGVDAAKASSPAVSLDRVACEALSENEMCGRILEKRIAAETATDRTCAPRVTPLALDAMPEVLDGMRPRRLYGTLVDSGCAMPGALVAENVRRIGLADRDGRVEKFPGLTADVRVFRDEGTIRFRLKNGSGTPLRDVWGVVLTAPEWMTRRRMFRVTEIAPGEMVERTFPLGTAANFLPGPVGTGFYAAHADFSVEGMRGRLWCVCREASPPLGFVPPNAVARYVEPIDGRRLDAERLRGASAGTGPLPAVPGASWKSPATPGAAWYNVTAFPRPYTEAEKKLLRTGDLAEAFAVCFFVPADGTVTMRFLPWLWDRAADVFLNGERVPLESKVVTLPVRAGENRLIARYRSKPGGQKACAQCPIYTWLVPNQVTCVPFPETVKPEGPFRALKR